jgi:hypothetical protein
MDAARDLALDQAYERLLVDSSVAKKASQAPEGRL